MNSVDFWNVGRPGPGSISSSSILLSDQNPIDFDASDEFTLNPNAFRHHVPLCNPAMDSPHHTSGFAPSAFFSAHPSPNSHSRSSQNHASSSTHARRRSNAKNLSTTSSSFYSTRLRSYDVYLGFHARNPIPLLLRFANWLRAELESHGLSCFLTDRARSGSNSRKRSVVEKAMEASTFGVVILTKTSFTNPYTIDELRFFTRKKNLVPVYFDLSRDDCLVRDIIERRGEIWETHGGELWLHYGGVEHDWRDAVGALSRGDDDWKLDAHDGRWRDCVLRAVTLLSLRLGRRCVVDRLSRWRETAEKFEFPYQQNENFVGRKKELSDLEFALFGSSETNHIEIETSKRMGKKNPMIEWKESTNEIEVIKSKNWKRRRSTKVAHGKGIACVSGEPGIGKTELLLEFAYRFHQRYKMVLWMGGESRYIRQNYLNLWPFLEINVGVESCTEKTRCKSIEEQEELAVSRIRKELMRKIPFLIVIDNLESENDWWDHKLVMDLLPQLGGETHVLISTRLSHVMNLKLLKLSYLSGVEAMCLMQGVRNQSSMENDALQAIEAKLGRVTLGLAIVGAILSELPISATRLLDTINRVSLSRPGRENQRDTFLLQLLEVCFSIFDHADGPRSLATRMVLASGWFAPASIPVPILAVAAHKIAETHPVQQGHRYWKKVVLSLMCTCSSSSYVRRSEAAAASLLLRFNVARSSTKDGFIQINPIVKAYARRRSVPGSMVQAVISRASVVHHADHIWAACFLLLGFGKDPITIELKPSKLVSLVKEVILPLAIQTFVTFSRCAAAMELLQLCTDALEAADEALVEKLASLKPGVLQTKAQMKPWLWQELALVRATVLEVRAKLMGRGGKYDVGDDLIRKAIFIRSAVFGEAHPDTVLAKETLGKLTRLLANVDRNTEP